MRKIRLVLRWGEFTSFTSYYLETLWREFFQIETYDPKVKYDTRTLFAVSSSCMAQDDWPKKQQDLGHKVIVDNLWECATNRSDFYWVEHPCWFLWNESLWWRALGYNHYCPQRQIQYRALMPIRKRTSDRDQIVDALGTWLPSMLWSYVARGQRLPFDDLAHTLENDAGQRFMHPFWYDSTFCTVAVETTQSHTVFVTEKTCKPLAYFHPFMALGAPGTLAFLKKLGYETFENIFDETYDTAPALDTRLKIISRNLANLDLDRSYDLLTEQKISHNHELFFDERTARASILREIVQPIVEYAET